MGKANTADQGLIQYEAGQEFAPMQQMDQIDRKTFSVDDAPWSNAPGFEPVILPDGLATGGAMTPGTLADDVDVAAATAYQGGVLITAAAATLALDRDGTVGQTDPYCIYSVVVDATGAYALEKGTEHATAFTEVRGDAGGPPLIPQGEIEVGQVRVASASAGAITLGEIKQIQNVHQERYDYPTWDTAPAYVDGSNVTGRAVFIADLPEIHVADANGNQTKQVHAEVYTPMFASLEPANAFVPPEVTHSQTSTQVYGGTIGSSSSALNQGSFTVFLKDGITDPFLSVKDTNRWMRFYPHRLRTPYILAGGMVGVARTFPADNSIQAACTLSADQGAIAVG